MKQNAKYAKLVEKIVLSCPILKRSSDAASFMMSPIKKVYARTYGIKEGNSGKIMAEIINAIEKVILLILKKEITCLKWPSSLPNNLPQI